MLRAELKYVARPMMQALHDLAGETVGLAVLDAKTRKGLIIDSVQGTRHRLSFTLTPGTHFPLHTAAPAKAILAFLPAKSQRQWLASLELLRCTPQTITTLAAFEEELAEIKRCGYALDRSEEIEGCLCVAAPILTDDGTPVGAVWITGPSSRLSIAQLHQRAPDVMATAVAIALALETDKFEAEFPTNDELVEKTIRHLEGHLAEKIDWHALAVELGASYSKLRHLFTLHTGAPPSQYHLNLRIEEAKRLLRESDSSIQIIAERVGFPDPNHFSVIFSKKAGLPPTRYRESQA